jgi:hypothetical protein
MGLKWALIHNLAIASNTDGGLLEDKRRENGVSTQIR